MELWSEKCLPSGTVHISLPRILQLAKKLEIDFAPAMVGYEIRNRKTVPVFEGIVVCKEYETLLLEVHTYHPSIEIRFPCARERLLLNQNKFPCLVSIDCRPMRKMNTGEMYKTREDGKNKLSRNGANCCGRLQPGSVCRTRTKALILLQFPTTITIQMSALCQQPQSLQKVSGMKLMSM